MSTTAECRAGTCGCASITVRATDADRVIRQEVEHGWVNPDGNYDWTGGRQGYLVTPTHQQHLTRRYTDPASRYLAEWNDDGWLVVQNTADISDAITRLRWTDTRDEQTVVDLEEVVTR